MFVSQYGRNRIYCSSLSYVEMKRELRFQPRMFEDFGEDLRNDYTMAWQAVSCWAPNVFSLGPLLRDDEGLIILALYKQPDLLRRFVHLSDSSDFILNCLSKGVGSTLFRFISSRLQDDSAFVLQAVTLNGLVLQWLDLEFRDDAAIVLAAVSHHGRALEFASPRLQRDVTILRHAVKACPPALQWVSNTLINDVVYRELVVLAVQQSADCLQYVRGSLREDITVVKQALNAKKGASNALSYVSMRLRNHAPFMLDILQEDFDHVRFCGPSLLNDMSFMRNILNRFVIAQRLDPRFLSQLRYLSFDSPAVALMVQIVLNVCVQDKWYEGLAVAQYPVSATVFYTVLDYFELGIVRRGEQLTSAQKIVEAFVLRLYCLFSLNTGNTVGPYLDVIVSFLMLRDMSCLSQSFNVIKCYKQVEQDYAVTLRCGLRCVLC